MSWKTRYISNDRLEVLNAELARAGFQPATANYAANLSNLYRGEIETARWLESTGI